MKTWATITQPSYAALVRAFGQGHEVVLTATYVDTGEEVDLVMEVTGFTKSTAETDQCYVHVNLYDGSKVLREKELLVYFGQGEMPDMGIDLAYLSDIQEDQHPMFSRMRLLTRPIQRALGWVWKTC
tara:strand:- start:48 stop:428 length:381 start_codon:yes stop_codon:yes gene_type:complete